MATKRRRTSSPGRKRQDTTAKPASRRKAPAAPKVPGRRRAPGAPPTPERESPTPGAPPTAPSPPAPAPAEPAAPPEAPAPTEQPAAPAVPGGAPATPVGDAAAPPGRWQDRARTFRETLERTKHTAPDPWAYTAKVRGWVRRLEGLWERPEDGAAASRELEALVAEIEADPDFQEARRRL